MQAATTHELEELRTLIRAALDEDIGEGDATTLSTIPEDKILEGHLLAKESGVIAGLEVATLVLEELDPRVEFRTSIADGERLEKGTVFATARGLGQSLLTAERVMLNFLQRMSGIATMTRAFVDAVQGTGAKILDTRKTAPGLRGVDKWAVRLGGGENHRIGLFDMVLIKDNHIVAAGSIAEAVHRVRATDSKNLPMEVEVKTLDELREALKLNVDRILLDNMSLDLMREAVRIAAKNVALEASGNVTLSTVRAIAETGVNYISIGALTHSVKALDIGFLIQEKK